MTVYRESRWWKASAPAVLSVLIVGTGAASAVRAQKPVQETLIVVDQPERIEVASVGAIIVGTYHWHNKNLRFKRHAVYRLSIRRQRRRQSPSTIAWVRITCGRVYDWRRPRIADTYTTDA